MLHETWLALYIPHEMWIGPLIHMKDEDFSVFSPRFVILIPFVTMKKPLWMKLFILCFHSFFSLHFSCHFITRMYKWDEKHAQCKSQVCWCLLARTYQRLNGIRTPLSKGLFLYPPQTHIYFLFLEILQVSSSSCWSLSILNALPCCFYVIKWRYYLLDARGILEGKHPCEGRIGRMSLH